jgi:high-affinity K+ transport system ATPase subunit B
MHNHWTTRTSWNKMMPYMLYRADTLYVVSRRYIVHVVHVVQSKFTRWQLSQMIYMAIMAISYFCNMRAQL